MVVYHPPPSTAPRLVPGRWVTRNHGATAEHRQIGVCRIVECLNIGIDTTNQKATTTEFSLMLVFEWLLTEGSNFNLLLVECCCSNAMALTL